jgi:hypothetical protein
VISLVDCRFPVCLIGRTWPRSNCWKSHRLQVLKLGNFFCSCRSITSGVLTAPNPSFLYHLKHQLANLLGICFTPSRSVWCFINSYPPHPSHHTLCKICICGHYICRCGLSQLNCRLLEAKAGWRASRPQLL